MSNYERDILDLTLVRLNNYEIRPSDLGFNCKKSETRWIFIYGYCSSTTWREKLSGCES